MYESQYVFVAYIFYDSISHSSHFSTNFYFLSSLFRCSVLPSRAPQTVWRRCARIWRRWSGSARSSRRAASRPRRRAKKRSPASAGPAFRVSPTARPRLPAPARLARAGRRGSRCCRPGATPALVPLVLLLGPAARPPPALAAVSAALALPVLALALLVRAARVPGARGCRTRLRAARPR